MPRARFALLAALVVTLPAPGARAYEDELTVGAHAGYGLVAFESALPRHGALIGLSASIGLDDIWSVRARLAYAYHPGGDPLHVGLVGGELLYLLDVLQVVPYFGAGLDGLGTVWQGEAGLEFGAHLVAGVEYLLSRDSLVGFDLRPHFLPLAVHRDLLDPVYVTATARFSLVFDL